MTGLFSELPPRRRPTRDLPRLTTGASWRPPTELPSLEGVKRLGFDTETCDPDLERFGPGFRRGAHVVGFSLALDLDGPRLYVPIRHAGGGNLDEGIVRRWALKELDGFDGELVGANLSYDLDGMNSWGVTFPKVRAFRDVLVAEPLLDEWRLSYSLDAVAKARVGEGKEYGHVHRVMAAYGWKTEREFKKNLWRLPANDAGEYAEGDADRPLRVLDAQLAAMDEEDREEGVHLRAVFDLECELIPILTAMRIRGVRVDVRKAEAIRAELTLERDRHLGIIRRFAGPKAEVMAPESFGDALEARGLSVPRTLKTRKPSVTKEWLRANAGDALVDAIAGARRVDYILNTFVEGHVFTHAVNGRIHPTFKQLKSGAEDGEGGDEGDDTSGTIARFACANPNLQNIPARDPYLGPLIRSMFVPEEGEEWQSVDASQIEYRYLVHYAVGRGAAEARTRYNEAPDTDFHVLCGEFLGADASEAFVRKRVKNTNFCKVYGGGAKKLALTFGCTVEEAEAFIRQYDRELPFVRDTFEKSSRWAERRGFITTVLGRKQRFPFWERRRRLYDSSGRPVYEPPLPFDRAVEEYGGGSTTAVRRAWLHKALNRKLQGSGADHMKAAIVEARRRGVERVLGPMLVTVHDEGNHSMPRTREGRQAAEEFIRCMEQAIPGLRVPVLATAKRGESWGACE